MRHRTPRDGRAVSHLPCRTCGARCDAPRLPCHACRADRDAPDVTRRCSGARRAS
jgi:hypothetical protein